MDVIIVGRVGEFRAGQVVLNAAKHFANLPELLMSLVAFSYDAVNKVFAHKRISCEMKLLAVRI
jgi:hypothetical protein